MMRPLEITRVEMVVEVMESLTGDEFMVTGTIGARTKSVRLTREEVEADPERISRCVHRLYFALTRDDEPG